MYVHPSTLALVKCIITFLTFSTLSLSVSHTHSHTDTDGSGIDIFSSPADTFCFNFYAKLFCSLCHTWIFTFTDPLCDHGDELMMINT